MEKIPMIFRKNWTLLIANLSILQKVRECALSRTVVSNNYGIRKVKQSLSFYDHQKLYIFLH